MQKSSRTFAIQEVIPGSNTPPTTIRSGLTRADAENMAGWENSKREGPEDIYHQVIRESNGQVVFEP